MKHLMVLIIALLMSSAAMAEGECQADRQKFCKDVAKSDVGACFDKHAAELSEACKAKREARAKKNAEESAKMGKEEGTHTEPGHGAPLESDTSKVDQPERRNPTTGNETPKQ
ncbi:MAG: hypothetical protein WAM06_11145 [Methyloceanibacter sp.]